MGSISNIITSKTSSLPDTEYSRNCDSREFIFNLLTSMADDLTQKNQSMRSLSVKVSQSMTLLLLQRCPRMAHCPVGGRFGLRNLKEEQEVSHETDGVTEQRRRARLTMCASVANCGGGGISSSCVCVSFISVSCELGILQVGKEIGQAGSPRD